MKLTQFMEQKNMTDYVLSLEYSQKSQMWLTRIPRATTENDREIVGKGRTTGESMDDFCKIVRGQTLVLDGIYKDSKTIKVPTNLTV